MCDSNTHHENHYHNSAVFGKNQISISGDSQDKYDTGLVKIVGFVVGCLVLVLVGVFIYWFLKIRRNRQSKGETLTESASPHMVERVSTKSLWV